MKLTPYILSALAAAWLTPAVQASVSLDRTRIIFDGSQKAVSVAVKNDSSVKPYLSQAWVGRENDSDKANLPLVVVPPLQRLEPDARSLVTVKTLPGVSALPQDRESLFYFNLRGIPPKAEQENTLQLAIQTRVKLFYRPEAVVKAAESQPRWQESMTLTRSGDGLTVDNPTPFYVVILSAASASGKTAVPGFHTVTVAPKSTLRLPGNAAAYGDRPQLTYINDFGGKVPLAFNCSGALCKPVLAKPVR